MDRKSAAALVATSILIGTGVGVTVHRSQDASASPGPPASSTTPSPTPAASPDAPSASTPSAGPELGDVVPGAIEPIRAGMSLVDAVATGLVELDTSGDFCEGPTYRWTSPLSRGLDLVTDAEVVQSIGMSKPLARTADGVTVGSDLADLRDAYGTALIGPEKDDYGQATMFVSVDDRWIGFLFDVPVDQLEDASQISFVEVSTGRRPGLLRDGC